jgi:RNA polymerase sigma-70 factor (ECF subfamily)
MDALTASAVTTMPDADRDLIERHRYGDETAFEEIYDRFGEMVYNLALRLSGEPEEAADLTQDAFLKIHRHLNGFRGRSTLRTWIYRVAINCCRSRYRRQRAWRTRFVLGQHAGLEQLPDRRRDPEERAIAQRTGELVENALGSLPRIYREAVYLRDIEGLTYEEIAQVLGLRLGTVRSRIARGRDRLRGLLEEIQ